MRIFLVLICSLALVSLAFGQQEGKKKEQKKGQQAGQVSKPSGGKPSGAGKPTGYRKPTGYGKPTGVGKATEVGQPAGTGKAKGRPSELGKPTEVGKPAVAGKEKGKPTEVGKPATAGKAKGKPTELGKPAEAGRVVGKGKPTGPSKLGEAGTTIAGKTAATGKPFTPRTFNLANTNKPKPGVAPAVSFQQGKHIEGSQSWQGSNYTVFRNYTPQWHDQGWWHSHSSNVVFIFGGWYALNGGYWYPAWGYDPNAYYAYDGPIYAYNNLPPDQVIANVQSALQQQGYYQGEVDGLLGPQTRAAIADYQRANGLAETAAIDQPTLQSLGMA